MSAVGVTGFLWLPEPKARGSAVDGVQALTPMIPLGRSRLYLVLALCSGMGVWKTPYNLEGWRGTVNAPGHSSALSYTSGNHRAVTRSSMTSLQMRWPSHQSVIHCYSHDERLSCQALIPSNRRLELYAVASETLRC